MDLALGAPLLRHDNEDTEWNYGTPPPKSLPRGVRVRLPTEDETGRQGW
jgi:hypothetical protein